jgi:hypothetical protein
MYIEEVVLASDMVEAGVLREAAVQDCDIRLDQKPGFGRREYGYGLYHRCLLCVSEYRPGREIQEYGLPVHILDPTPKRVFRINPFYPVLSLLFALLTAWVVTERGALTADAVTVATGACFLASLLLTVLTAHSRIVFFSRNGRVPLVSLFCKQPDRRTVSRFVCALSQYIDESGRQRRQGDYDAALNDELREHRRLKEGGRITARAYADARTRILRKHG